jgi:hypothetical protein
MILTNRDVAQDNIVRLSTKSGIRFNIALRFSILLQRMGRSLSKLRVRSYMYVMTWFKDIIGVWLDIDISICPFISYNGLQWNKQGSAPLCSSCPKAICHGILVTGVHLRKAELNSAISV